MEETLIYPPGSVDREPEPDCGLQDTPPAESEDWQEATLRRLEAWIEERERLIAELERRIEGQAN